MGDCILGRVEVSGITSHSIDQHISWVYYEVATYTCDAIHISLATGGQRQYLIYAKNRDTKVGGINGEYTPNHGVTSWADCDMATLIYS